MLASTGDNGDPSIQCILSQVILVLPGNIELLMLLNTVNLHNYVVIQIFTKKVTNEIN